MTQITKVLIANRGEIACRILRTLNRMELPAVVVHHWVDADSPALAMADEAVEIAGETPVAAYLDVEQIVAACRQTGADAVHPGFGFLSENAEFARRLAAEDIVFIGPDPETMALMGNKVRARAFCLENNIPLAPSAAEEESGADFFQHAQDLGMPLLIKAAAGGGGKGMHLVENPADLEQAVRLAKAEALRSFGSDRVYAEQYLRHPRHIEVQVLADDHGTVVHLGERECSIQRRFQKVIEESPAPGLPEDLRQRICATAVEIARCANYRNAGTVEFILSADNEFYFLEMNTRIQVEHPVTEMVTGLDLVELQIRIARGEPLPFDQGAVSSTGHSVEMRLYAEDPENGFLPATGPLLVYRLPSGPGIRVDDGFREGMQVTSAFDPMLAKLIVWGEDRSQALARARQALSDTVILGVVSNADLLKSILAHPDFSAGSIHTGFIDLHGPDLAPKPLDRETRHLLLAAAAMSSREFTNPAFFVPEPYTAMGEWRN